MRYRIIAGLMVFLFVGLYFVCSVPASDYPKRPIVLLTMVQRNAQIDLLARGLSKRLSEELEQPVSVVNRPGGFHGSVMARELKEARSDGYTLGVSATAAYTYTPHSIPTEYSLRDFDFISKLGLNQSGIVALPERPWETLEDAFEWAREEDEILTYIFQGSDDRDAMQRIADQENVEISLVPSTGGPSVISAVKSGYADIGHLGAILFEHVEAGDLSLLAASTPERLTEIPEVPTLKEQGWDEAVEMYVVLVAPKGVPHDRIARLEEVMLSLEEDEDFQEFVTKELIMAPVPYGREYAETYMQKAHERFADKAKEIEE